MEENKSFTRGSTIRDLREINGDGPIAQVQESGERRNLTENNNCNNEAHSRVFKSLKLRRRHKFHGLEPSNHT